MTQSPQHNFGTPTDNWASGHQRRKDPTAWVPALVAGAVIFAVGCGSGLIVGWFGGAASGIGEMLGDMAFEPAEITIETIAPDTVIAGEPFEFVLIVTDTAGKQRTIRDIDFSGSLCDNMRFVSITPPPNTVNTDSGYREQVYNRSLGANQTLEFVFELVPNQAGIYTNEISVYMDDYNSEYASHTFEVEPSE